MIGSYTLKIRYVATLAATLSALAITGTLASAASPQQTAIAARQAGYKKMGAAMKLLNDQLKTSAPSKDIMSGAARTIAMTAREQPKLFPAGSGPTAGVRTDALPDIWTDRATFDGQMNRLLAESGKLVAVVNSGNVDTIRAQVKATGGTCSACHRQFRADT